MSNLVSPDELELTDRRASIDSSEEPYDLNDDDYETQALTGKPSYIIRPRLTGRQSILNLLPLRIRHLLASAPRRPVIRTLPRHPCVRTFRLRRLLILSLYVCVSGLFILIAFTAAFRPSYTKLPRNYHALYRRILHSKELGRGNPNNETIFIAISLYDKGGQLASGPYGQSILDLIDLLGPDNVFLSIYENDSGKEAEEALMSLKERVKCQQEIVYEEHISMDLLPKYPVPDGTRRVKRIQYLADLRNRALKPLNVEQDTVYDRVLFLNDVYFSPVDAVQLLFSTNVDNTGRAHYISACAVDFVNPFKFYDTFAARDLEGYSMGVPFYPWFSSAGSAQSRRDVLDQKDAVRVKSCWGGMVAVDGRYIQSLASSRVDTLRNKAKSAPPTARFRGEGELYSEASECCLIHADMARNAHTDAFGEDNQIYMNPYVRVGYSPTTLSWLALTRRFERLYVLPHWLVNTLAGMPAYNPHRTVREHESYDGEWWAYDEKLPGNGSWKTGTKIAENGMFCNVQQMQVLVDGPRMGGKNWEKIPVPSGSKLWS